jgi:CNT family concentrative nucleoside transporter
MMQTLHGVLGLALLLAVAWLLSSAKRAVDWRSVAIGLTLQGGIALALLKLPMLQNLFLGFNGLIAALVAATSQGTAFVFGYLGGGPAPFDSNQPQNSFILAFQALPLVLVYGALAGLLYHYGIIQHLVRGLGWVLRRSMRIGGAAGISTAANVFVGMVEAPLFIRPWLARLSSADLFLVMTAGMATIAGNMMVLYATFLQGRVDNPVGQLLTASLISAPAAVVVSLIMRPNTDQGPERQSQQDEITPPTPDSVNGIEAMVSGALAGVQLLINIVAMLLVVVALVALVNGALALLPTLGGAPLSLQGIVGWLMIPFAWAMGLPWDEAVRAAPLLGSKIVLNELVAYLDLAGRIGETLSPRARVIMTYALCSFANFGSLGIMIGGLVAMVPQRRAEIARLGPWTLVSGTLATVMTGAVVGLIV